MATCSPPTYPASPSYLAGTAYRNPTDSSALAAFLPRHRGNDVDAEGSRADGKDVLVADASGSAGKVMQELRMQRPDLKRRLVVQDLAWKMEGRVVVEMVFGIFTEQPVKGS